MDPTASSLFDARHPSMWNAKRIPHRVTARAYTKVTKTAAGCWVSGYSVASHGYAQIGWSQDGRVHMVLAHRASWEYAHGAVPVGMSLDHMCRNRRCVNPDHLRLMDNFENARRTYGRNWESGECANGHSNKYLLNDVARFTKSGERRWGRQCPNCRDLYRQRSVWRSDHPGIPYPEELMLGSEKKAA